VQAMIKQDNIVIEKYGLVFGDKNISMSVYKILMDIYKMMGKTLEEASNFTTRHGLGVLLGISVITIAVLSFAFVLLFAVVQIVFSIAAVAIAVF
jgi:hypothetical protein